MFLPVPIHCRIRYNSDAKAGRKGATYTKYRAYMEKGRNPYLALK
jgi:hypothetical protein